ncbi:MAG: HD domain-containing protein, partial [Coriobacteriia bacterium]|nr:HD domain-containing protein [Coriobacteriia bacterium]
METHLAARQVLLAGATPGIEAARELSKLTDEAVRELARAASSHVHGRLAIVALGGWGAGALLPGSDLDILVLADGPSSRVKPFVEAVLYPLWDSGLAVGHQVRSPKEQLRAMREDFVTCTAALTARPLAGDLEWAARHVGECARDAHKRSRELLAALVARPRPGSCYLLEPDLKEGAGGRRDYDELTWTAAVLTGIPQHDPSALVDRGLLLPEEFERLTVHAETLATARWILAREGYGNLLSLDALDVVPDELAQATQLALAETALILGAARRRLAGQPDPGSGHVTSGQVHEWLDQGLDGLSAIEQAAQSGRLEELAPGFRELMTVRRPGLGHQLTVGAHSLRAAALLDSLRSDPVLARSAAATPSLPALQVAAIAHDVGKIDGGADHPQRGAAPAHDIAARFGLDERWASHVSELVRLHLALAEMATHVDLDDEDSVLSAAARIGDRGLLGPLHLLTAADSNNTKVLTILDVFTNASDNIQEVTYYFRTAFDFPADTNGARLWVYTMLDDGAVIYLNGQEAERVRMTAAPAVIAAG